jgi:transcriptional regulator with GAF, ATPase, and Fis domain
MRVANWRPETVMTIPRDTMYVPPAAVDEELLRRVIAQAVGRQPMQDFQSHVRRTMLEQALTRANGNLSRAAKMLGITRQGVQQMVSRYKLDGWLKELRQSEMATR